MRHPALIDCLYLVERGVPYDISFSLNDDERMAYIVAFGTLSGLMFDWSKLKWSLES